MKKKYRILGAHLAAAICILGFTCTAKSAPASEADAWWRPDSLSAQAGAGHQVDSVGLGAAWDWNWHEHTGAGLVTGSTELSLARWRGTRGVDDQLATQVGITPMLRLYPAGATAGWFVEAGIGANAISPVYHNGTRKFSTVFNFGDRLGVGRRFGDHQEHEFALRVEHFSNCGVSDPNPGENFLQMRYVRHF